MCVAMKKLIQIPKKEERTALRLEFWNLRVMKSSFPTLESPATSESEDGQI